MENQESKPEINSMDILADKLDALQAKENNGLGVSCVRTPILYLRRGEIEQAKAVCLNDGDKIRNYPEIEAMIEKELLQEKL